MIDIADVINDGDGRPLSSNHRLCSTRHGDYGAISHYRHRHRRARLGEGTRAEYSAGGWSWSDGRGCPGKSHGDVLDRARGVTAYIGPAKTSGVGHGRHFFHKSGVRNPIPAMFIP